ncbi:NAD(P)-dependent dehydrogenase (short-subunit alcohol dehydrogenase family) [Micromonospora sp. Llam0]|uniref:SDR family NAD(P)-dependent oxidoreductase n=1 Tax=Micromonospora sp. Llam0 TaxID=2485143 RepID=UPI000F4879C7|nr:SDR family NAD(P)-dependent oxidoreductase [Micromonospora sp. Llam0]ROO62627.1 NAD(P)-dependent dehydrogenase (short-subunit alcohol dehydrogenase family) [Micromonospora sp. Llam0]
MGYKQLTLITGGSRGIGRCLVQSFLAHTDVLNVSRTPARDDEGSAGHKRYQLHHLSIDLANTARVESLLTTWLKDHPDHRVTTLIHNAAVSPLGWLHELSDAEVEQAFRVNVYAPLAITASLQRIGRFAMDGARVVYVTSSLARPVPELSFACLGLYSMTKAALNRMALIQSREFELTAPHITVIRAHPGIVDTDLQRDLRRHPQMDPAFKMKTARLPPYREGEWHDVSPRDHMRTVSPEFSAEFIEWVTGLDNGTSNEYDFYQAEEFHAARGSTGNQQH